LLSSTTSRCFADMQMVSDERFKVVSRFPRFSSTLSYFCTNATKLHCSTVTIQNQVTDTGQMASQSWGKGKKGKR